MSSQSLSQELKNFMETYPETPDAGNALEVMHIAYTELESPELADDAMRILELNYPDHPYINGRSEEGFFSKLWPFN